MWRRLAGLAAYSLFLLALVEGASAAFWLGYGKTQFQYQLRTDLAAAIARASFDHIGEGEHAVYDRELGWLPGAHHPEIDAQGARHHSRDAGAAPEALAFGDSFVFGEQVAPDESFPFYLSEKLGAPARNFGVGGFGPDQALLRLERELGNGLHAPVIVLGMPSENIARVVGIFFRNYVPTASPLAVKPLFLPGADHWELVNSLPEYLRSPDDLQVPLTVSQQFDLWHAQNRARPQVHFPYTGTTLRALRFFARDVMVWQDLYRQERAVATLTHILDSFATLGEIHEFHPVFVVIPMPEDLQNRQKGRPSHYAPFLAQMRTLFGSRLTIVDVMETLPAAQDARFHVAPFQGHASAYGNQVVAEALFRQWPLRARPISQRPAGDPTPRS